jgi:hypothetical protein
MEPRWRCTLHPTQQQTRLLLSDPQRDLLKARLRATTAHPRALMTLLEGWSGAPLRVALSVDVNCPRWLDSQLWADALWPAENQLVAFDLVRPGRRRNKLSGLGDFRQLRLVRTWGAP